MRHTPPPDVGSLMGRRFMVLSASMGAGHDMVAGELARRLEGRGHQVLVRDVLTLLPPGTGPTLRAFYRASLRYAPRVYEALYAAFLSLEPGSAPGPGPNIAPLANLAERRLVDLVEQWRPDAVVSTFHLAAYVTGRLRLRRALPVPSAVCVIDFAVHRGWLHPGNDLYVCVSDLAAETVRTATGRPAVVPGPVVPPEFQVRSVTAGDHWAEVFARHAPGRPPVLLSAGAWGIGPGLRDTARALSRHGCLPVLLCGRDERLRRRAEPLPGVLALGWVDDMPGLMSAARALVDNAAGQTAVQALAAGLPVVGHHPIPGHGAMGVREMAGAGLSVYAADLDDLRAALDRLVPSGPERTRYIARGRSAFRGDAARPVADLVDSGKPPPGAGRSTAGDPVDH